MNKIIEIKFGSHLYGTDTPSSDLDIKGIYLPEPRDIVLGEVKRNLSTSRPKQEGEKNNKDDIDQEFFSLKEYLRLLCEGQTVALDMLFAEPNSILYKGPQFDIFTKIYENRFRLISKNITAFFFYAKRQAAKYGVKGFRVRAVKDTLEFLNKFDNYTRLIDVKDALLEFVATENNEAIKTVEIIGPQDQLIPHLSVVDRKFPLTNTVKNVRSVLEKIYGEYGKRAILAEQNEGCDWKALSHSVRVNSEGSELLLSGKITFPRPDRELLLKIKTGQLPYKEVADIIEKGLEELEQCQKFSELRLEPDYQWAENLVYEVYSNIVKNS